MDSLFGLECAPPSPLSQERTENLYFSRMALLILVLNVVGFTPAFLRLFSEPESFNISIQAQRTACVAMFLLFLLQTNLGVQEKRYLHRNIGMIFVAVALLFLLSGLGELPGMAQGYVRADGTPEDVMRAKRLAGSIWDTLSLAFIFAFLLGMGLLFRKSRDAHKRYMLLAVIVLSSPGLAGMGEFPYVPLEGETFSHLAMMLLFASLFFHDRRHLGRIHDVTLWGVPMVFMAVYDFSAIVPFTARGHQIVLLLREMGGG